MYSDGAAPSLEYMFIIARLAGLVVTALLINYKLFIEKFQQIFSNKCLIFSLCYVILTRETGGSRSPSVGGGIASG